MVLPAVMLPTMRMGRRIRRTSRSTQERQAELNQILQETLSGHMVVKAFGAEGVRIAPVPRRVARGCSGPMCATCCSRRSRRR